MKQLTMKKTPGELARCYEQVSAKIDQAYAILLEAKEIYKETYDDDINPIPRESYNTEDAGKAVQSDLKRYAWRRIVDLMQVQKLASSERWKEIQSKLYDRHNKDDMPEISESEILKMYQSYVQNANAIFAESVKEVYDYLRPGRWRFNNYKTNRPDKIGEKVILTRVLEHKYSGGMKVNYYHRQDIMNVDKVFHALDGNTEEFLQHGYKSVLVDAINENPFEGENKYFSWKGYHNGNLHLTIKRMDLVADMSRILRENSLMGGDK